MEAGLCVNSRRMGGTNVDHGEVFRVKNLSKIAVAVLLNVMVFATMVHTAAAALPAPTWMPGFPLVAGTNVILMWSPVPGAVTYTVYMNGKKVSEGPAFQSLTPLPAEGGEYSYWVTGVDASGKEGEPGKKFVYAVTKMEAPKEIIGLVRDGAIFLRWDSAKGAMVYNVYKKAPGEKDFKLFASVQDLTVKDAAVKEGEIYSYSVSAKSITGAESGRSSVKVITVPKIEAAHAADQKKGPSLVPIKSKQVMSAGDIQKPFDVAILKDLFVVAAARKGNSKVYFIDQQGEITASFVDMTQKLPEYTGVFAAKGGTAYTVDRSNNICYELDSAGKVITQFPIDVDRSPEKEQLKKKIVPFDVVELGGKIYISDQGNDRILVFGKNGSFDSMFSMQGRGTGQLMSPTWMDTDEKLLYVVDGGNVRIQVFDPVKKDAVGMFGSAGNLVGQFMRISGLGYSEGALFIGDSINGIIQKFSLDGVPVGALSNELGTGALMTQPTGIAVRGNMVAVAVAIGDRLQVFTILK